MAEGMSRKVLFGSLSRKGTKDGSEAEAVDRCWTRSRLASCITECGELALTGEAIEFCLDTALRAEDPRAVTGSAARPLSNAVQKTSTLAAQTEACALLSEPTAAAADAAWGFHSFAAPGQMVQDAQSHAFPASQLELS